MPGWPNARLVTVVMAGGCGTSSWNPDLLTHPRSKLLRTLVRVVASVPGVLEC